MRFIQCTWLRLLVGATAPLACELDVQLSPGGIPNRLETDRCRESEGLGRFLLAVQLFEDAPPLQLGMCVVFVETYTGSLSMMGWTRRLRPDDRRAYGDLDLFGGPAVGFEFDLEPAVYWTSEGPVEMTLHLHGDAVDEDFLCGHVEVEIAESPDAPLGRMTFAARRLDTSVRQLPDPVVVDCLGRTVPAL